MNKQDSKSLQALLDKRPIITIIPHTSPDGDAIGSTLGLYHFLKNQGHDVQIIAPTDFPDFLKWMPEADQILIYPNQENRAEQRIADSSLIFTLDFNNLLRAKPLTPFLQKSLATFVMIDHHQQPDTYATITYSDEKASSTCELIYNTIVGLSSQEAIDQTIATCLYTGIMTDTGGFRFSMTSPQTHRVAAVLLEKGANCAQIASEVLDSYSIDRLQLLGTVLDGLTYLKEYKTAYMSVSSKILKQFNFRKGDTEGFVNYGLRIKEAELAVIFIENEEDNLIKISFRSKTTLDVNLLARMYFNGGGHINAAGGSMSISLEDTIAYFLEVLPKFLSLPNAYQPMDTL
ncbi:bifunctional oligoribonuclease/PAP phosphatase NrnA [Capnocytophaga gingivalis]|uniref:DHH family phosphoesterase n=1 Tax=Capnocytophaga gingivalis TaxID=1017 RepID=UPI0028E87955|nr:bifunctional oligoribonuclease/PAP phosphatase NrnA [Capnocytophaga gingivalis]